MAQELIPTKMLIMRPELPHETREVQLPEEPGYVALRDIICPLLDGAHLEHVNVWADFAGGTDFKALDMFVDEDGLLKGLMRNEAATVIYRRANLLGMSAAPPAAHPEMLNFIAGTAILFDRRVWF